MKCLIIRFSSIGDIVLTSPVIRCLKEQLGAEIHYLSKERYVSILKSNPYIDRVLSIKNEIGEIVPALKGEDYDLIIDLHKNIRTQRLKFILGKPTTSFSKLNLEKWLLVHFGLNRMPDKHIVNRYMESVAHLGVQYDGKGLDYYIPEADEVEVKSIHAELVPEKYTAFVLGATHVTKRLPALKNVEFCEKIKNSIVLIGGPSEKEMGDFVRENAPKKLIINTCGQYNLNQSASLIRQAQRVITHDTGMMHIAAAFEKEIISIWGSTVPEFGMYPFYPNGMDKNTTLEVANLGCRPCSKIGFNKCPKGHFKCMEQQELNVK